MIFNAYRTIDAVNTTEGIHTLFLYVNEITSGLFSRLFLVAFFLIMTMSSFFSQQRLSGKGDLPASLSIAGFITSGAAIIMTFLPGLVNTFDVIVTLSVTFGCVLWLFMSKRKDS